MSRGHMPVVQYLLDQVSANLQEETLASHPEWTREAVEEAVQMKVVKWIEDDTWDRYGANVFFHDENAPGFTTKAMDVAAEKGHLDIVQFLHENRKEGCTTNAIDHAAKNGRLDIVQFLDTHRHEGCTAKAMDQAAANGYLDVVQYLHTNRQEGCTSQAMTQAALNGHLDVVQFLHENRSEGIDPTQSRKIEHFATLAYLYANQLVKLTPNAFYFSSSLETVEFVYDHCVTHMEEEDRLSVVHTGLKYASRVYCVDAGNPVDANNALDLPCIQFLDSKRLLGEVFVSDAMYIAAATGNLNALKYLHNHGGHGGCTAAAMDHAAKNGHLDIIQFLHENRSEGCTTTAMDNAAKYGHFDVVQFLHQHRSEGCTTAAMESGNLDIIQFLHENRSEGCTTTAMDHACANGHLDIVQFLHSNRSEGGTAMSLDWAASDGHLDIVKFLCAHRPNESCIAAAINFARREKQKYMMDF